MGIINKLVLVCDGTPITFDISQADSEVALIQETLDSVPSEYGTFVYTFSESVGGIITSTLTVDDTTCTPYFYKDGVPYTATVSGGSVVLQIGEGLIPLINVSSTMVSETFTVDDCCEDCKTPQFVNDIYEGDTFIPYSLAMVDGTVVSIDSLGGDTVTISERGCIELSEPVIAGQEIRLKTNECENYSPIYKVKSKPQDCDFYEPIPCFIKVLNIKVRTVNEIYGKIESLNTSSYGELKYRIDNGDWYDSWTELGEFPLNNGVVLGIKSKASPTCKIEYPLIVVQKFA